MSLKLLYFYAAYVRDRYYNSGGRVSLRLPPRALLRHHWPMQPFYAVIVTFLDEIRATHRIRFERDEDFECFVEAHGVWLGRAFYDTGKTIGVRHNTVSSLVNWDEFWMAMCRHLTRSYLNDVNFQLAEVSDEWRAAVANPTIPRNPNASGEEVV